MRLLQRLEKERSFWFLLFSSFFFFLLRLPSLFEPYWYGDEGIYQVLGMAMNRGRLLYRDIWDNKPPLLYFVYSLFNSDQFYVRLLSLITGVLSLLAFYYLSKKLFKKAHIVYLVTAIYGLLLGLPVLEGNIANAENFMLLPTILAAILIFKFAESKIQNTKYKIQFIAGFLLSVAFLFKIVAVFDFAAFFVFIVLSDETFYLKKLLNLKSLLSEIKKVLPFTLSFITPIFLTAIFFLLNGSISYFLKATFFANVGYVGYGNKLIIPQGFLILKLALLGLFCLYLYAKRKSMDKTSLFIWGWFAFSLFNAFFSQRPYTHYLLNLLPAFVLLLGLIFYDRKLRLFSFLVAVISLFLVLKNFWIYSKTFSYYGNFVSFVAGTKSVSDYQGFFDKGTPVTYEVATYINANSTKQDSIFLWGNNAMLYKLTDKLPPGKYAVAYHITSYSDGVPNTKSAIALKKPKFIVIMPNVGPIPFSLVNYKEKIAIDNVLIYERVF
jgi:Dolichyl-phosphate-mannose-protein mannosyltransferase